MSAFKVGDRVSQSSETFSGLPPEGVVSGVVGEGEDSLYELDFGDSVYPFYFRENELKIVV